MGFWGSLGKIALKAAPIAAAFIPGVGPLASMAIGGATGAASKKLQGGSWKQALGAGAMGAGTSALGSVLSGAKLKDLGKFAGVKGAALTGGQQAARGIQAGLGGLGIAQEVMAQRNQSGNNNNSSSQGQGIGPSSSPSSNQPSYGGSSRYSMPSRNTNRGAGPRGLPYGIGAGQTPNLGAAFASGRQIAMANQPFRAGAPPYQRMNDETGLMEDIPGDTGRPPIYPNLQGDNMFGLNGGGIGPSRPPMDGGMQQPRPPSYGSPGGQYGGQPGVPRNIPMNQLMQSAQAANPSFGQNNGNIMRPMQPGGMNRGGPGSQMGRAMMGMGHLMGMGGGSQYNAPGMGQFNPGMSMIPPQQPSYAGDERVHDMGPNNIPGQGIGPSTNPMEQMQQSFKALQPQDPNGPSGANYPQTPEFQQAAQNFQNMGMQAGNDMSYMNQPGGALGGGIGPSDQMQQNKMAMMMQQPQPQFQMPQFQQRLMNRGGMQRNQPMMY